MGAPLQGPLDVGSNEHVMGYGGHVPGSNRNLVGSDPCVRPKALRFEDGLRGAHTGAPLQRSPNKGSTAPISLQDPKANNRL